MALTPPWLLGQHLTALTAVGGVRDATTGAVTFGSATSIADSVDFVRFTASNEPTEKRVVSTSGS